MTRDTWRIENEQCNVAMIVRELQDMVKKELDDVKAKYRDASMAFCTREAVQKENDALRAMLRVLLEVKP